MPLFFGRLVGIPTNILAEVVTLTFVAKPVDFLEQKFAMAETLKVLPWYDPIFIDPKLTARNKYSQVSKLVIRMLCWRHIANFGQSIA